VTADEHPEDLLDRARQGGLPSAEQTTLEHHLAQCAVCAVQLSLAPRFERELAPQPRDELLYQRAAERAIQRLQQSPVRGRRRALPRWSRWAAAAALLVVGVTGAAAVVSRRIWTRPLALTPAPIAARPVPAAAIRAVEPAPVEAPPAPPEAPPAKAASAMSRAPHPAVTAATLFELGEGLRREGRVGAAISTYRRLQATFPATAEAHLSFALAGQLLLKQGRPGEALAAFDRHLRSGDQSDDVGGVREEALAGRADALEQLHRGSEAAVAWKVLLARYPRSVYADKARARLEQLTEHP
jgi:tetratricopeptide (TPR) repeat protein